MKNERKSTHLVFIPGPNPWHAWRGHCPPYTDELVWPVAVTFTGCVFGWPSNAKYGCVSIRRGTDDQRSAIDISAVEVARSRPKTGERRSRRRRRRSRAWRVGRRVRGSKWKAEGACDPPGPQRSSGPRRREGRRIQLRSEVHWERIRQREAQHNMVRYVRRRKTSRRQRSVDQGAAQAIGVG